MKAFTEAGGWIIFNNLAPDGLADYNRLVGVDHIIRPFKKEKVTWSAVRNPITSGLQTSNIVFGTGELVIDSPRRNGPTPMATASSSIWTTWPPSPRPRTTDGKTRSTTTPRPTAPGS